MSETTASTCGTEQERPDYSASTVRLAATNAPGQVRGRGAARLRRPARPGAVRPPPARPMPWNRAGWQAWEQVPWARYMVGHMIVIDNSVILCLLLRLKVFYVFLACFIVL